MAIDVTFNPAYTKGITVAPAAASASSAIGFGSKALCITNLGSVVVYVRVGGSGVAATTADYPILPITQLSISKEQDETHVAYLVSSGTGSLHIIPGEGF